MRPAPAEHNAYTPDGGAPVTGAPEKGAPDWELRRWFAAVGVSLCAVSLVLSGHVRSASYAERTAEAERLAEKTAIAEEFVRWRAETIALAEVETSGVENDGTEAENAEAPASFAAASGPELILASADISDLVRYDFTELEVASIKSQERRCMADALYYESRNETMLGKLGVADVVLNRVKSPLWPDTVCGVVYQGAERRTGCQFSFTCDGSMKRRRNDRLYADLDRLAGVILAGMHMPVSRNATHYHANYVDPYWAPSLTPTAQIGAHKFYRFPGKQTQSVVSAAQ